MAKKSLKRRGGQLEERLAALQNRRIANTPTDQSLLPPANNLQQQSYVPVSWEQQKKDIEAESIRRRQVIDDVTSRNARTKKYIDEETAKQSAQNDASNRDVQEGDVQDGNIVGDVQEGDVQDGDVEDDLEEWEKDSMIKELNGKLQVLKDHYGENYSNDKNGNALEPRKKDKIMKMVNEINNELKKYKGGKSKSNKRKSRKNKKKSKSNKRKSKARKSRKYRK